MKHTQGKWEIRKCGVDHRIIVNNPAKFIASTRTPGDKRGLTVSGEEDEANAKLMATAPELLKVCAVIFAESKRYIADGSFQGVTLNTSYQDKLADIIAKATE